LGVRNFRGRNEQGGLTELSDWERIALNGRPAYIAFDSDVMEKREVYAAMRRLSGLLTRRGARPRFIYLPPGPHGALMLWKVKYEQSSSHRWCCHQQ
jgi:hypothetical protein